MKLNVINQMQSLLFCGPWQLFSLCDENYNRSVIVINRRLGWARVLKLETFLSLQRPPCLLLEQRVLIGPQDPVTESWLVDEVHLAL